MIKFSSYRHRHLVIIIRLIYNHVQLIHDCPGVDTICGKTVTTALSINNVGYVVYYDDLMYLVYYDDRCFVLGASLTKIGV